MCEVLTSFRDRSPVDDHAFPLSAEVQNTVLAVFQPQRQTRREEKPPWHQEHKRRRSTQAAGQDRTARSTRHKRQQAVNGWQPKCVKSTGDDDSSLSCGRNHGVSGPSRSLKVSSTLSCDEQLEEAQREVPCLSRHEPVPQPEGQSASRPECLVTQPCPDCFSRPRASRSSSLGRGVGPVFLLCAPSFSSLFFRFSVLVSRVLS